MSALVAHPRVRPGGAQQDRRRLRERMEAAVERLLAALDAMDGDPDLEDGDDAEAVNEDGDVLDAGEQDAALLGNRWRTVREAD